MTDLNTEDMMPGQGPNRLPQHVAIIMDGNGRWAQNRGLPRTVGHKQGADAVRRCLNACRDLDIRYLTLFGFSSENWNRPAGEVRELMRLMRHYLRAELAELHQNGIRLRVIGDRTRLTNDIVALIEQAESLTADNDDFHLTIAISYGGRQEIVTAAQRAAEAVRRGDMHPNAIDETVFSSFLDTSGLPDPDLLIRTSGEQRISNFLLWQMAYAELVFSPTLWPDFSAQDLIDAIQEFNRRDRRFGALASAHQ
ncbi:MAG: isoprenyl transferase [Pseudomonadota bacterium]